MNASALPPWSMTEGDLQVVDPRGAEYRYEAEGRTDS